MQFIHQLHHLNSKNAEIEATQLLRELKKKTPAPFDADRMLHVFAEYFVSDLDINGIKRSLELLDPTVEAVRGLLYSEDKEYEPINLQRAISTLEILGPALKGSLVYAEQLQAFQDPFVPAITELLNNLPYLKTDQERAKVDKKLTEAFVALLRIDGMSFNTEGIVYERELEAIESLRKSMHNGFLFHITLEEELHKLPFYKIAERIPEPKLAFVGQLHRAMDEIGKGVERAYQIDMRAVEWAVIIYAYIKWMTGQ